MAKVYVTPVDARPPAKNLRKRAVGDVPDIAEFAVAVMQMSGAAVKSVSQFLSKKHWTRCSVVRGSGEEGARGCEGVPGEEIRSDGSRLG